MKTVNILNVKISDLSRLELLGKLKHGGVVFTPNVDHVMKLQGDSEFRRAYELADYKVCDSQILMYVSRLLKEPIREKISGSDFFSDFYNHYKDDLDIRIFLLGGAEGVAEKARQRINEKVGRNIVVKAHSPSFGFEKDENENKELVGIINESGATVLAIGVGAPKQEKWILRYKDELKDIKVVLAIGATIDFESGLTQRAPKWVSSIGLEWLYRLIGEPRRLWRRYLMEDPAFFLLVLKQLISSHWLLQKRLNMDKYLNSTSILTITSDTKSLEKPIEPFHALLMGPSLTQKGGMASVQKLIVESAPQSLCVKHISIHDEGSIPYRIWVFARALGIFLWELLRNKVDLVHLNVSEKGSVFRNILLLLIAKAFGKPVVMHAHGCEFHLFHDNLSRLPKYLINLIFKQADGFIALSESWKEYYITHCELERERVIILHNPVEIPEVVPNRLLVGKEVVTFSFLGRIGKRKGAFDLIQAFAAMPVEYQHRAQLILAGDGEIDKANDLIKELKLTSRVKVVGWINEAQRNQLLLDSSAFALPSYNEGLPMSVLEAMAWGLPIIATPVGGIPEVVEHAKNGLIVQPGNVSELSKALEMIVRDESLRLLLGNSARDTVQPLGINLYCGRLAEVYRSCAKDKISGKILCQ